MARKPTRPQTTFVSQTEAKDKFLAHCRHVSETKEVVCVTDQSGVAFLTLTVHPVKGALVTRSAQFFKDHFARCSSLIRDGIAFKLTNRSSTEAIYAGRHGSYNDPVDPVIDEWRENIVKAAMADADESAIASLASEFAAFASRHGRRSNDDRDEARVRYETLVRGIARMAIGHKPFDEGQLPNRRDMH
jgi:hypothetical protein